MQLKDFFPQDDAGNLLTGGTATVYLKGTQTLATGLADAAGNPVVNPVPAAASGRIQFRAPMGDYDVLLEAAGFSLQVEASFAEAGDLMPSASDMQALRDLDAVPESGVIYLKSHTTAGDGGNGTFRWEEGAAPGTYVDNGDTIIVPAGGDGSAAWVIEYDAGIEKMRSRWSKEKPVIPKIIDLAPTGYFSSSMSGTDYYLCENRADPRHSATITVSGDPENAANHFSYDPGIGPFIELSSEEPMSIEFPSIQTPKFSWTVRIRFICEDTNQGCLVSQGDGSMERWGIFLNNAGLQYFRNGRYLTLTDEDLRDGVEHDVIVSFDMLNGFLRCVIDGSTANAVYTNNTSEYFPDGGHIVVGNYPENGRDFRGKLLRFEMWPAAASDRDLVNLTDFQITRPDPVAGYLSLPAPQPGYYDPDQIADFRRFERISIYIILGQSNAAGRGDVNRVLRPASRSDRQYPSVAGLSGGYDGCYVYTDSGEFKKLRLPENNRFGGDTAPGGCGPEVSLGYNISILGEKAIIIRHAVGGTGLLNDWNPNSGSEGAQYLAAIGKISSALSSLIAKGYMPIIRGVLWMQGERDARGDLGGGPENYYESYLETLIDNLRIELKSAMGGGAFNYASRRAETAPFVIGGIKIGPSAAGTYPDADAVIGIQKAVAASKPNCFFIDTSAFPQNSDDLHFSEAGQYRLGQAFFNAVVR